jgi:hypothetical protein
MDQTLAPEACGSLIHASNVEQLVAWFKLLYVPANRLNLAGHINAWPAWPRDRRFAPPEHDAKDVRHAFQ